MLDFVTPRSELMQDTKILYLTEQNVLDETYLFLKKQGCRSYTFDRGCSYRTPQGLKCAIGYFIEDDKYHEGLENNPVEKARVQIVLPEKLKFVSREFLIDLQKAHDNLPDDKFASFLPRLKNNFAELASCYNLKFTP